VNGTEGETLIVALAALAGAPWVIAGSMLLTGRWKIMTPAPKKGTKNSAAAHEADASPSVAAGHDKPLVSAA
jgi:hypothetical protein